MPKSIGTFCSASRSHLAVKKTHQHVWISDEILSETFAAFARRHKRHGSNVPGPLEARRRASRRRATQLAHTPATNYNPESFGLFDTQTQQGWWQKEPKASAQKGSGWHWPFSLPQVISGPPPPPPVATGQIGDREAFEGWSKELDTKTHIRDCMHNVRTHTELVDMLSGLSINLRHRPDLAKVVFGQMLAQYWEHEQIAEFLLDPRTNPPGTTNHLYVLQASKIQPELVRKLLEQEIFVKAADLGLLSVTEIQQIVLLVPTIDPAIFPKHLTWATFCLQLLDGMESSKVLRLQDLEVDFMRKWLESMPLNTFCLSVPELLWRLHKYTGSSDMEALQAVSYASISMVKSAAIPSLHDLSEFLLSKPQDHIRTAIFRVTDQLMAEARCDTGAPLMTTSLKQQAEKSFRKLHLERVGRSESFNLQLLEARSRNDPRGLSHFDSLTAKQPSRTTSESQSPMIPQERLDHISKLELWYAVLANLGSSPTASFWMHKDCLQEIFSSPPRGADAQQYSLGALWTVMAISACNDASARPGHLADLVQSELCRTFLSASEDGSPSILTDLLANLHQTIQSSPLPFKNKLLRRISTMSGRFLNVKQNYWDLGQHIDDLSAAQILQLRDDKIYNSIKFHLPASLTAIAECLNTDMKKFEETCMNIVKHAESSIVVIFRLLQHNLELKRALRQAAVLMYSAPYRWDNAEAGSQEALGGYSYRQLVGMMHRLAQVLAESEHLPPRSALSKVWWIRMYLERCDAPLKPPIGRALWHAGVTRYRSAGLGPCYRNVRWLFQVVEQLEGTSKAHMLLRRAGVCDVPRLLMGHKTNPKKLLETFPIDATEPRHERSTRASSLKEQHRSYTRRYQAASKVQPPNVSDATEHIPSTGDDRETTATSFKPLGGFKPTVGIINTGAVEASVFVKDHLKNGPE